MKISFQNPTQGPLITVSFDDEVTAVAKAFSIIGASRVTTIANNGLATLRTAAQFSEAEPGAAGGGASGAGIVSAVGPLALIGMFFAAGDSPTHTRTPDETFDGSPTLSPSQLRCLADPYNTSAECAAVRSALSTFPTASTQPDYPPPAGMV